MKHNIALIIASLLAILLLTLHLVDDIVHGLESGGPENLVTLPVLAVWLYAALFLAERRSGFIIILLESLLAVFITVIHMIGKGVGGNFAKSSGAFFFIWTLIALGTTALFSAALSVRGLWTLQWRRSR